MTPVHFYYHHKELTLVMLYFGVLHHTITSNLFCKRFVLYQFSYDDTMILLLEQKMWAKVFYENDHSFWLARFCLAMFGSKRKLVSVFSQLEKLFLIGKPTTRISEEREQGAVYRLLWIILMRRTYCWYQSHAGCQKRLWDN